MRSSTTLTGCELATTSYLTQRDGTLPERLRRKGGHWKLATPSLRSSNHTRLNFCHTPTFSRAGTRARPFALST